MPQLSGSPHTTFSTKTQASHPRHLPAHLPKHTSTGFRVISWPPSPCGCKNMPVKRQPKILKMGAEEVAADEMAAVILVADQVQNNAYCLLISLVMVRSRSFRSNGLARYASAPARLASIWISLFAEKLT